jgi:hypothetical protein
MADYAAEAATDAGTTATLRTGSASSDTVPAGAVLAINNTGAGSHNVDLAIGYTWHGLYPGSAATAGKRRLVLAAGSWTLVRVAADMGDANGRVAVAIDGSFAEIKYLVVSA